MIVAAGCLLCASVPSSSTAASIPQGVFPALSKLDRTLNRLVNGVKNRDLGAPLSAVTNQAVSQTLDAMSDFPTVGFAHFSSIVLDAADTDIYLDRAAQYVSDVKTRTGFLRLARRSARNLEAEVEMVSSRPHTKPWDSAVFHMVSVLNEVRSEAADPTFSETGLRIEIRKVTEAKGRLLKSFGEESGLPFGTIAIPFESILVDLMDAQSPLTRGREILLDLEHARSTKEALERTLGKANQQPSPVSGGGPPPPPVKLCGADGNIPSYCAQWSLSGFNNTTNLEVENDGPFYPIINAITFAPTGTTVTAVNNIGGADCTVQNGAVSCNNLSLQTGYSMTVQLQTTANLSAGATGTLTMSSGANPSTPQPPVTLTLGG